MKLYFFRHGETDWNIEGKIQAPDSDHLTQTGIEQAKKIKNYLTSKGIKPDTVFCSDTVRTKQTRDIIFPYEAPDNHPIITDKRLNERYYKALVGENKESLKSKYGELEPDSLTYHLYYEGRPQSRLTREDFIANESLEEVRERVAGFIIDLRDLDAKLSESKAKENVFVIIGHLLANRYYREYLERGTVGEELIEPEDIKQAHNEVVIIEYGPGKIEVKKEML